MKGKLVCDWYSRVCFNKVFVYVCFFVILLMAWNKCQTVMFKLDNFISLVCNWNSHSGHLPSTCLNWESMQNREDATWNCILLSFQLYLDWRPRWESHVCVYDNKLPMRQPMKSIKWNLFSFLWLVKVSRPFWIANSTSSWFLHFN